MRKEGFYWVKYKQPLFEYDEENGEWIIAEWNGCYWSLAGEVAIFDDEDFEEIDEIIIIRPDYDSAIFSKVTLTFQEKELFDKFNSLNKSNKDEFFSELAKLVNQKLNK